MHAWLLFQLQAGALLLPKGPPSCSGKLEDHASKLLFSQGAEIGIRQWRALVSAGVRPPHSSSSQLPCRSLNVHQQL